MTELNGQTHTVTVVDPYRFTIGDTRGMSPYVGPSGTAVQQLRRRRMDFQPLEKQLATPTLLITGNLNVSRSLVALWSHADHFISLVHRQDLWGIPLPSYPDCFHSTVRPRPPMRTHSLRHLHAIANSSIVNSTTTFIKINRSHALCTVIDYTKMDHPAIVWAAFQALHDFEVQSPCNRARVFIVLTAPPLLGFPSACSCDLTRFLRMSRIVGNCLPHQPISMKL